MPASDAAGGPGARAAGAGAAERTRWSDDTRWMVGLFAGALAIRLLFVLVVQREGFGFNDLASYHAIALNLSRGDGYVGLGGEATAQWPPVYPFALSLVYRIFGENPTNGEVFNAFIAAASVTLTYFVTRRILGPREARFAGVFMLLMPAHVFFTDALLSETLYTFTLLAFLALAVSLPPTARTAVILGAGVGIAALSRGEGPLIILIPLAMWWSVLDRRTLAIRAGVMIATAAVIVVPWVARNYSVFDSFVGVSTNSGDTFYSGHNPKATGGASYASDAVLGRALELKGPEGELERNRVLRRKAIDWALSNPHKELALIPARFLQLNQGDSQTIGLWLVGAREVPMSRAVRESLGVLANIAYYALLTLFVLSLLIFGRRLLANAALRGILVYLTALLLLYIVVLYGNFRYRVPVEPLMMMVAAPLAVRIWALRASGASSVPGP
jgi:4-amino-4-deoxy-L-arabinose transferase-like glycosyltransferase